MSSNNTMKSPCHHRSFFSSHSLPLSRRTPRFRPHSHYTPSASASTPETNTRRHILQTLLATIAATTTTTIPTSAAHAAQEGGNRVGEVAHPDAEWQNILTPEQYAVLRTAATERRYSSPLVDEHRKGTFLCAGCSSPLFSSDAKYESGTGWPSFTQPIPNAVDLVPDTSILFMPRTEVRCHRCQGHLGHVFPDGPQESTGLRFCMNGVAMTFEPATA